LFTSANDRILAPDAIAETFANSYLELGRPGHTTMGTSLPIGSLRPVSPD
jgi:hypothetical protein